MKRVALSLTVAVLTGLVGVTPADAGPKCNRANHRHWSNTHNHWHYWTWQYTSVDPNTGARYEMYFTEPHGYYRSTQDCSNVAIAIATDTSDPYIEDVAI